MDLSTSTNEAAPSYDTTNYGDDKNSQIGQKKTNKGEK